MRYFVMMLLALSAGLAACGEKSSPKKESPAAPQANTDSAADGPLIKEIASNQYVLLQNLTFADAEQTKRNETSLNENITRYSYFWADQKMLKSNDLPHKSSYCEIYTDVPSTMDSRHIAFDAGTRLKVISISTLYRQQEFAFDLTLQARVFQNLNLSCVNTQDSAAIVQHIGNLFSIAPANPSSNETIQGPKTVYFDEKKGSPQFGVQYANDIDKMWNISLTLNGRDLNDQMNIQNLSWRLYDSGSKTFINNWKTEVNGSPTTYPGGLSLSINLKNEREILAAISNLRNLKILLAVNQSDIKNPIATHIVDLGAYCQTKPEKFVNLSTGTNGCGKGNLTKPVFPKDLPKIQANLNNKKDVFQSSLNGYCKSITELKTKLSEINNRAILPEINKELQFAKTVCSENTFVGLNEKDVTRDFILLANVEVAKQGLTSVIYLFRQLGDSSFSSSFALKNLNRDYLIFLYSDLERDIDAMDFVSIAKWAKLIREWYSIN